VKKLCTLFLIIVFVLSVPTAGYAVDSSIESSGIRLVSAYTVDENGNQAPADIVITEASDSFNSDISVLLDSASTPAEVAAAFHLSDEETKQLLTVLNGETVGIAACCIRRTDGMTADGRYVVTITCDPSIIAALYINHNNVWKLAGIKAKGENTFVLTIDGLPSSLVFLSCKPDGGHISPQTGYGNMPYVICGVIALGITAIFLSWQKRCSHR